MIDYKKEAEDLLSAFLLMSDGNKQIFDFG